MLPFILITIAPVVWAGQMTLCEYFRKLGVDRPECGRPYFQSKYNTLPQYVATNYKREYSATQYINEMSEKEAPVQKYPSLPLCSMYFHSCMPSLSCESGTVCVTDDSEACCTDPSQRSCPSPSSLKIQCRKMRGVNWCSNDYDCRGASTMPAKCCPSGCNYNMCIHLGVPQMQRQRRFPIALVAQSDQQESCPDPYTLKIKCTMHKPVSWCLSDAECPSPNPSQPRKCCTTLCGYTTCLVKYNGKWTVG